jgi:hypothetical protein
MIVPRSRKGSNEGKEGKIDRSCERINHLSSELYRTRNRAILPSSDVKEALIQSATQSALPLTWGIYMGTGWEGKDAALSPGFAVYSDRPDYRTYQPDFVTRGNFRSGDKYDARQMPGVCNAAASKNSEFAQMQGADEFLRKVSPAKIRARHDWRAACQDIPASGRLGVERLGVATLE